MREGPDSAETDSSRTLLAGGKNRPILEKPLVTLVGCETGWVDEEKEKMSIKARIEDAESLWRQGRKEGAWLQALVAVAATSRKRYPKPVPDNEAFKSFIRSYVPTIIYGTPSPKDFDAQIIFGGVPFEDILYKHLRCSLLHEAKISELVTFSESEIVDGKHKGILSVGSPNQLPDFLVLNLINVVKEAPENASLFDDTVH